MNLIKKIMMIVAIMTFFVSSTAYSAQNKSEVSKNVPKIASIDASGLLKKIASEKGKVVVVNIFASWCPPCREETPGIIANRKSFSEDDVSIMGISVDKTPAALNLFVSGYEFNYPIFLAEGQFVETFGIKAIPQMLIYNRKGEVVFNHKGLLEEATLHKLIAKEVANK